MNAGLRLVCAAVFLGAGLAQAQPVLNLARDPLLGTRPMHANVLLSLSVEFPTVGAAYRESQRNYDPTQRYIGYFNADLCYRYDAGAERFEAAGVVYDAAAGDRRCSGLFAGNFMNWATMSAMDIFRMTLTGGRRVVDGVDFTVLERAWIPTAAVAGSSAPPLYAGVVDFYASAQYFPRRWVGVARAGNDIAQVAPAGVTPFNRAQLSVVSCRDQVLFGDFDGSAANCDDPASDGRFAVGDPPNRYKLRVKVCDALDRASGRGGSYCINYGDSGTPSWKPVGEVQMRADSLRFGVLAYLLDQNQTRYGGVLRHPLGYLGARTYDARFRDAGANPRREWDAQGRFIANPLAAAEGRSGFVGYLNDFGSVPGSEGAYKRFDTASEMFYEAVRYLQWHRDGPTAKATSGLSTDMKGGFPVHTDWSADPLVCPAQPSALISISDTNTWNDWEIPGNDRCAVVDGDCAKDAPRPVDTAYALDIRAQTAAARAVAVARGMSGLPDPLENATNVPGATNSYYIAGLAQYGRGDIRPDTARSNDPNAVGAQQFTTISIDVAEPSRTAIGQRQLNVAGVVGSANPGLSNYMLASSPQRMVEVLRSAFARIAAITGSAGGGALTAATLTSGGTGVFVPYYDASAWSGEVEHYRFVLDPLSGQVALDTTPMWRASAGIAAPASRSIWLGTASGGGRELQWNALSSAEQSEFDLDPSTRARDGLGERRVAWLRGSRADEAPGLPLRPRATSSLLGDIVNAEPAFVAAPASRYPGASYESYAQAQAARRAMLYVATNAGLVHGIDAASGAERFAFAPPAVLTQLPALTHPAYRHQPLIDAPLVAGDAWLGNRWATLLVGGYGAGLQGLFAIDVTDPDPMSADKFLWQFGDADDVDMGNVLGRPLLAPLRVGSDLKWFVIVASGYNNHAPDGAARSDGRGALFFLDPAKPAGDAWALGRNYWKVTVPLASTTLKAGLAQPAAVFDVGGVVTQLYAGDLQGRLWKFDVSDSDPVNWGFAFQSGGQGTPLFVATDSGGAAQPITTAPAIAYAPGGGYLLLFGTGKMIEAGDNTGPYAQTQSFYAVQDAGAGVARSDLAARNVVRDSNGQLTGAITGTAFSYGSGSRGWVFDFPESTLGEQQISSGLLAFNALFFNSVIPGVDPCLPGRSSRYCVDPLTGLASAACGASREAVPRGFLSPPASLIVQSLDGGADTTGRALRTTRFVLVEFATGIDANPGTGDPVSVSTGRSSRAEVYRIGWRELINWRELRRP